MKVEPRLLEELETLPGLDPPDYFHGVRAPERCEADNLLVFLRRERRVLHERGFATGPHHRYVLIVNLATTGTLNVDGVAYPLRPGSAFLIAPYQLHFYMDVAAARIRWLFFTFEAPRRDPFEPFLNIPLRLSTEHQGEALELARDFSRTPLAGAIGREHLLVAFTAFLTRLKREGLRGGPRRAESGGDPLVARIHRLLAWHLAEGLDVAGLAGRLAISESHLRRRFRELTGLSLGNYLLHYRLHRAIKLLVHSELSLTQIALECGYESLAAFSRAFKAKVGQTPSRFRQTGGSGGAGGG